MSANIFSRLRALLPPSPVLIARVLEHHDDDTSTVELPLGLGLSSYTAGLVTGSTMRVRGRGVAVGLNAFVRDGRIESEAPAGDPVEVQIGRVIAEPLGPQGLALAQSVASQSTTVGAPFELDLAAHFSGWYAPLAIQIVAGALPGGLVLDSATGVISGAAGATGLAAGLVARATDATGLTADTNPFDIEVT